MRRIGLIGAALVLASPAAFAQQSPAPTTGPYLGIAGGANFLSDQKFKGLPNRATFSTGSMGEINAGWGFGNGLRVEADLDYRDSRVDKAGSFGKAGGDADALTGLVTGYYDFDLGLPVTPYLGAGIGAGRYGYNGVRFLGTNKVNDRDAMFSYQGAAGINYPLNDVLKLDLGYRYLGTTEGSFHDQTGASHKASYSDHTVLVGLRFEFGAHKAEVAQAAPPPPPAPPPQQAPRAEPTLAPIQRSYLVFFDWDRSDITAEAQRVIDQAAQAAKQGQVPRLMVTGHTDTTGSVRYNQALSERRAVAVKAALVRDGIPADGITTTGRGKSQPLVPTGDGVREPQNRRAEIALQ